MKSHCPNASTHRDFLNENCMTCGLAIDQYGNTEQDFINCSFPDCGCDGARLCMAGKANKDAVKCNVEGMYQRSDSVAKRAKMELISLCIDRCL